MYIFSALADHTRRDIIETLASSGKLSASEICDKFSLSHPAISQHLKVLRDVDLVFMEKRAQQHIYEINPQKFEELEVWISKMRKAWCGRFDTLDALLAVETQKSIK